MTAELEHRGVEGSPGDDRTTHALLEDSPDKINIAKAFNANYQMLLAEKAEELAVEAEKTEYPVKTPCVDSLTAKP